MNDRDFEAAKAAFEHNSSQFRALNLQMNGVPTTSITLTGGLWFAAGVTETLANDVRFTLLILAGLANIALVMISFRIRDVMQSYLEKIKDFCPEHFAPGRPTKPFMGSFGNYSMISLYAIFMIVSSLISFFSAFFLYWSFTGIQPYIAIGVPLTIALMASVPLWWSASSKNDNEKSIK